MTRPSLFVRPRRFSNRWLLLMLAFLAVGVMGANGVGGDGASHGWRPFGFLTDPSYDLVERTALLLNVVIALGGLLYAWMLMRQVYAADEGTERMKEIARAVREGADAYLKRQFTTVGFLIVVITIVLVLTKWPWDANAPNYAEHVSIAVGRGVAFLMGSVFSALVGFGGMRLATAGNVRVAAAARKSFGKALQLGYRTGTVTGMLTDGLGLLGGSLIFLYYGEKAYEALLGFGFGGTLLALFMRVGGGIYTKAADVGADLVGKIEKDIPEDDPRNAATIADNVGDNVGDCAGMAADIFESYEVTIVAAMILGYASFGHKGVIFPLLVRAIGVIGSIISTYSVRADDTGNVKEAMRAVNRGFWIGAAISIFGFMLLGFGYLRFDKDYIVTQSIERGLYKDRTFAKQLGVTTWDDLDKLKADLVEQEKKFIGGDMGVAMGARVIKQNIETKTKESDTLSAAMLEKWKGLDGEARKKIYDAPVTNLRASLTNVGVAPDEIERLVKEQSENSSDQNQATVFSVANTLVPLQLGLDMRAAWTCLIGIFLALALNFCTEYWTGTEYNPVKSLAKSCRTGHATNIIQGIAVGFESAVWAVIIIAAAIFGSVLIYGGTNPIFIAFGVAMCGIGMLTLTGNTISMDVFGPVADNANGIGEMGFNRDSQNRPLSPGDEGYMPPEDYKRSRQILSDLDAVGNTTKAITKGIAIGSAVIAAVSLFASFIAVLATGTEEGINRLSTAAFLASAAKLTVAEPYVFIGLLLGGAVPFLFSSMTIRAVGRAAYLIVHECRVQFKDAEIWAGTKKPDYARVVDICTNTAQKELVGPGLLAIFTPVLVGFLLGPYALGGFLAGMILSGQLIAVFMANAGGAWDNAKKMIEDQPKGPLTGKGSDAHKASVTGDTVGDPLKDTAGPAVNPLIKVMNMVSLLILPLVISHGMIDKDRQAFRWSEIGLVVLAVSVAAVAWAWWQSKRESAEMKRMDEEFDRAVADGADV